jgi:hypothetical protein
METLTTERAKKGQYETERDSARIKGTKEKEVNKKEKRGSYVVKCEMTRPVYRSRKKNSE